MTFRDTFRVSAVLLQTHWRLRHHSLHIKSSTSTKFVAVQADHERPLSSRRSRYCAFLTAALRAAQICRYLVYSEADFEVFRPAGATRCTDGGEMWHGGGDRGLLHAKFHPHRCNESPLGMFHVFLCLRTRYDHGRVEHLLVLFFRPRYI